MGKPLKRDKALQPLSREHHHALLFCWKIRTGLNRNIELSRIRNYVFWFYQHHLLPHFAEEENLLFPLLGNNHELVKIAIGQHQTIHHLFAQNLETVENLHLIDKTLEQHIRFEERILFNEIQNSISAEAIKQFELSARNQSFIEDWKDPFWK
ncbi:MAG: hemerythrin domain-containing protein [Sphingobacteriales bacterium]|nr:MAG: hemerythrin domain-containing protein [Sphingobacteriales bacterium]